MFKIPKIEKGSFYIDAAMKSMQDYATKEKDKIHQRFSRSQNPNLKLKNKDDLNLDKRKDLELEKIRHLNDKINISLKKLIKRFPNFNQIDNIYIKLINASDVKIEHIEDATSRIKWITKSIDSLTQTNEGKIKRAKTQKTCSFTMKKYLGKVNSYFRKNKKFFSTLDDARKLLFLNIFSL